MLIRSVLSISNAKKLIIRSLTTSHSRYFLTINDLIQQSDKYHQNFHTSRHTSRSSNDKNSNKNESKNTDNESTITVLDKLLRYKPLKLDLDDSIYNDNNDDGIPDDEDLFDEDMDGEPDPRFKLGKLLLSLGKIHYRHAESYSGEFLNKLNEICSYRSKQQIRRCLKDWMLKNDRDILRKYRLKSLKWGSQLPADDKIQQYYIYGPEETAAYAFYFMPSRYYLLKRVLKELKLLNPHYQPIRTLDFGCGTGSSAFLIDEVYGKEYVEKYTGVDISQSMIDAAKIMSRETIRDCMFYTSNSDVLKKLQQNPKERYHLAVASYTLSELPNDLSRRIAVQLLFESLEVGGYLVILESGNPMGSHTTRTGRQFVLDVFNNVSNKGKTTIKSSTSYAKNQSTNKNIKNDKDLDEDIEDFVKVNLKKNIDYYNDDIVEMLLPAPIGYKYEDIGAFVVSPCTHDQICPMATGGWCSFSQKVYSGMIRKESEEKFSYVVIQKRPKISKLNTTNITNTNISTTNTINNKIAKIEKKSIPTTSIDMESNHRWGKWQETANKASITHDSNNNSHYNSSITDNNTSTATSNTSNDIKEDPTPLNILHRFMNTSERKIPILMDQLLDEINWLEYNPPLHREEWGRIIRSPIKSKGHITLDICSSTGSITRTAMSKGNMLHIPSLFTALRKTTWGGLFPVLINNQEKSAITKNKTGLIRLTNNNSNNINTTTITSNNNTNNKSNKHNNNNSNHNNNTNKSSNTNSNNSNNFNSNNNPKKNKVIIRDALFMDKSIKTDLPIVKKRRNNSILNILEKIKNKRKQENIVDN